MILKITLKDKKTGAEVSREYDRDSFVEYLWDVVEQMLIVIDDENKLIKGEGKAPF